MKRFLIALQFLTILPFSIKGRIEDVDFGGSLAYFPIVGFLLGFFLSGIAYISAPLPPLVTSILILAAWTVITGSIHLDGFADTCDGFYGSRLREETLRIMRDSRVGAMGVVGVILLLLLKFSLIISIPRDVLWRSFVLMCCFSRWIQAASCLLPYARDDGKAGLFIKYVRKKDIIIGGVFTIIVSCALFGLKGIIIFFGSLIPALIFIRYVKSRIGGMTGDTIGAVSEIAEVSTLFSILILWLVWI